MSTAADHVPDPADENAQLLARLEFELPQLAEIHARQPARYTPDSDRTPAAATLALTDPDPEC